MSKETKKKPIVIAGTYPQFFHWCRENNTSPNHAIYADSIEKIRGLQGNPIVYVGTWHLNPILNKHPFISRPETLP